MAVTPLTRAALHNIQEEFLHEKDGQALELPWELVESPSLEGPREQLGTTRALSARVGTTRSLDLVIFSNLSDLRDEVYGENECP